MKDVITNRKTSILVLSIMVAIVIVVSIIFVFTNEKGVNFLGFSDKYTLELTYKTQEHNYEVRVLDEDKSTRLYENGEEVKIITVIPRQASPILVLPDPIEPMDIRNAKFPISDLTWESNLLESSNYLKYLEKEGYVSVFDVVTSQYIEKILESDEGRLRVVIFSSLIMIGEYADDVDLPVFSDYMKKYTF